MPHFLSLCSPPLQNEKGKKAIHLVTIGDIAKNHSDVVPRATRERGWGETRDRNRRERDEKQLVQRTGKRIWYVHVYNIYFVSLCVASFVSRRLALRTHAVCSLSGFFFFFFFFLHRRSSQGILDLGQHICLFGVPFFFFFLICIMTKSMPSMHFC